MLRSARLLTGCVALACVRTGPSPRPAAPPASATSVPEPPPITPFAGSWLPTPPQQGAAWAAPPGSPPALVRAAAAVFDAGFADPRGLEYRAIKVTVGSVWGGVGEVETHGWLLPGDGPPFAVTWSGLVYPVVTVGAAQDLAADVAAIVAADERVRAEHARDRPDSGFTRHPSAQAEADSVSHATLQPLKVAALLRLGEAQLAADLWTAFGVGHEDDDERSDPLLLLARDWTWALFDRAVCAHMRADDRLALASVRALTAVAAQLRRVAASRGTPAKQVDRALYFLAALPALLADQERRAAPAPPPETDRIAALVRDLDEVRARQRGQPGGVSLGEDPRVLALIAAGDAAVEPLLVALERDTRLTRSVHFHRDFHRDRTIMGAHEAAYAALSGIYDTSFFAVDSTAGNLTNAGPEARREVVVALRAFIAKWKGVAPDERAFQILADDSSPPDQWLQAADSIVRDRGVWRVAGTTAQTTTWSDGTRSGPRGVGLRERKDPSLNDLLIRRIDRLAASPDLRAACRLASLLAEWDARGGLIGLTRLWHRARDLAAEGRTHEVATCLADLTLARDAGKDPGAVADYAVWLSQQAPADLTDIRAALAPLWHHPARPEVKRAAEAMFADPRSPWARFDAPHLADLAASPALRLRPFRELVLRALADDTPIGTFRTGDGTVAYEITGGERGSRFEYPHDPRMPAAGTTSPLRRCDHIAWTLAVGHRLEFRPYLPEPERGRALAAVVTWVRTRGLALSP